MTLDEALNEFERIVDDIYGTYLDSLNGYKANIDDANELEVRVRADYKAYQEQNPEFKDIPFGDISRSYGRLREVSEEGEKYTHLHQAPQSEFIARNEPSGRNAIFLGNLSIVAIYQYWEDHYRKDVAKSQGVDKDNVVAPIFGDLRLLRRSIIHNKGRASSEINKCSVISAFTEGDQINISKDIFEGIIDEVISTIRGMKDDCSKYLLQT